MDGTSNGEQPPELYVYVDESVRELPDGRRLVGAGALIATQPIGADLIDRALVALESDPDRHDENRCKQDERTLRRRHFHASDDNVNARSALSREIRASVRGKFECSFAEAKTRRDEQDFRMHSIVSILPALAERLPLNVVFELRSGFGRESGEKLIEHMNQGFDWATYQMVMWRTFYPRIEVRVEPKGEPGLQVADLLLWGALQQTLDPTSRKTRVLDWCGAYRWAHGGHDGDRFVGHRDSKYFINHKSPWLGASHDEHPRPYPVSLESLDDIDSVSLANLYCFAERVVRAYASGDLPEHAEHLRPGLKSTLRRLRNPDRVGAR
jgi:hypothetical protein